MKKRLTILLSVLLIALCAASLLFFAAGCNDTATQTASNPSQTGDDGSIVMTAELKSGKVDVVVRLKKNCGINQMLLTLQYDTKVLTLTGMEEGAALKSLNLLTTNTTTEKGYSITPFKFSYLNEKKNDTSTGTMFTLHFSVKKNATAKQTTVGLKYDSGSIKSLANGSLVTKQFSITPATVSLS